MFEGYKKVNKKNKAWLIILLAPPYFVFLLLGLICSGLADVFGITCRYIEEVTRRTSV